MTLGRRGFSLIEILVATIILSFVVLGFTSNFMLIEKNNSGTQRQLQAADFARATLEDLLKPTRNYVADPDLSVGEHKADSDTLTLTLPGDSGLPSGSRTYKVETLQEGGSTIGKQITVTVGWDEGGKAMSEQLFGLLVER
jgi:prepilin-type N-terminal cleavage/methylation domain-containing protein